MDSKAPPTRLVVFSDDWGRHPSSCQHLVARLLDRYEVLWVNTIGTRAPTLSRADIARAAARVRQTLGSGIGQTALEPRLQVISPWMYPGFRRWWQRRLNAQLVGRACRRHLSRSSPVARHTAVTTLPITADLVGHVPVKHWVYYCVDDFSVWPGLDGSVMDAMERQLVARVDVVVAVSEVLQQRIASLGRDATLITHGIDLEHWQGAARVMREPPPWGRGLGRPVFLFWGVVDRRLDADWCLALADECGALVLVGPQQDPDPRLAAHDRIHMPGPAAYGDLPALAAWSDVLVMPYADLPVTRAMQPLKLKEYLATGKPALLRRLPATEAWSDAADVVASIDALLQCARARVAEGTPPSQEAARGRLQEESWDVKARMFEKLLTCAL